MKFDSDLGKAIHFLWISEVDLAHAALLHNAQISYRDVTYKVYISRKHTDVLDASDQVYFPAPASIKNLQLQLLISGTEKFLKGLLILNNFVEKNPEIEIKGNGHNLRVLWDKLPLEIRIEFGGRKFYLPFKEEIEALVDIKAFLKIDYSILRYGIDTQYQVPDQFDFKISPVKMKELLDKLSSLNRTAGSCIFSMQRDLRDFPTKENYPKVILYKNGNETRPPSVDDIDEIRITNKAL